MALVKHSKRTLRSGCDYCASTDIYWAHDTDRESGAAHCDECRVTGRHVLVNKDGSRHLCKGGHDDGQRAVTPEEYHGEEAPTPKVEWRDPEPKGWAPVPKPEPVPATPATPSGTDDAAAALAALQAVLAPKLDRAEVQAMIRAEVGDIAYPTRTIVVQPDGNKREIEGATHPKLADVTTNILGGEHVLMVGPAGTGKSTIAEQAAESLGLAYYSISLSPMTPASQILGYMQAEGQYVRSLFREAYESGGVFHFDEFDNGHPSVLAVVNAALANGSMAFPDGMVKRHDDFRCVASANTYGRGADRAYVGRQQIDAATLDRFAVETIEVDEALESTLCHATGLDSDRVKRVLTLVRKLRKNAADKRMTVVLSPRASVGMCRLLAAGRTWDDAIESRVRRGMSDADWTKLNG